MLKPEYFDRLGARLESEWCGCDRDEEAFADLAAAAIRELPPAEHVDVDDLVTYLLDPNRPAERPLAPLGAFGQPGFTAHYGRGFVVDVYFWAHALSAIHDHPFCGAFTILRGHSVHARYGFELEEALGTRVRLGRISLEDLELVEEGHVERFSLTRHPLVHTLLHVPVPTVSMVVRTIRTEGYFRYFPPGVALAMDEPDELIGRSMMLLDTLRAGGDPAWPRRLSDFLGHADFETSIRALSRIWGQAEPDALRDWIERIRERHGDRADRIAPALDQALRAAQIDGLRAQLTDSDDRLVATALMAAESREQVVGLLALRHDDPESELRRFVTDVCREAESLIPD